MRAASRPGIAFLIAGLVAGGAHAAGPAPDPLPEVLVSRQLLETERLAVGDVVSLSADAAGAQAQRFRVAGSYEPTPDPQRLGSAWLEARLHLPDWIALSRDRADPAPGDSVGAINVRLVDPGSAPAFAEELSARMPGLVVRPTTPPPGAADPFVVLERFHLAIALVTIFASSMFLLALMVMLVDERRETMAILRMIGLRRRRILLQVLAEGFGVAVAGAAFGVLLALLLEGGFNRFFQWHYDTALVFVHVTPRVAWRSVALAVPLGVLASFVSSWGLLRSRILALARR